MDYREALPSAEFSRFIRCFWSLKYRSPVGAADPETVLPDGCPEIVFNLSDRFRQMFSTGEEYQPPALFAGQMRRPINIRPSGNVHLFGVRFQPAGAAPVLVSPLNDFTDRIVDLADAGARSAASEIADRIMSARTFSDRIRVFETFFGQKLSATGDIDETALRAAETIVVRRGQISIGSIAERLGSSSRRLERSFRRTVGIAPKTFARIIRFQSAVRALQAGSSQSLIDGALKFGYYDQSHMIREFRELSGTTPMAFLSDQHRISDVFTGRDA